MVEIGGTDTVYLACGATDMRKEIDGLAGLVEQHFKLDPFSRAMFVFCSKDKSKRPLVRAAPPYYNASASSSPIYHNGALHSSRVTHLYLPTLH